MVLLLCGVSLAEMEDPIIKSCNKFRDSSKGGVPVKMCTTELISPYNGYSIYIPNCKSKKVDWILRDSNNKVVPNFLQYRYKYSTFQFLQVPYGQVRLEVTYWGNINKATCIPQLADDYRWSPRLV